MAGVKVNLNLKKTLESKLEAAAKEADLIGVEHVAKLKALTDRGKGFNDKGLKQYSKSYKKQRQKEGRRVSPPDLRRTGQMLQALTSKQNRASRTRTETKLFFLGGRPANGDPSAAEKAEFVQKLGFRFFGISRKDRKTYIERIRKAARNG